LINMPMIYVTENTLKLIRKIMNKLENPKEKTDVPTRIVQADVIHAAVKDYAQKLNVE